MPLIIFQIPIYSNGSTVGIVDPTSLLYITVYYTAAMEYEDIARLMEEYGIDEDTAEKAQELIDDGLDEDEAIELADEL